jgi:hypothetical protein
MARKLAPPAPRSKGRASASGDDGGDLALVYGKDEQGLHVLRRRSEDGPVEVAVLQPLVEGKPINSEVISLSPHAQVPFLFKVKTEIAARGGAAADEASSRSDGPAQVSSDAYRKGWDEIWGRKRTPSRHLN